MLERPLSVRRAESRVRPRRYASGGGHLNNRDGAGITVYTVGDGILDGFRAYVRSDGGCEGFGLMFSAVGLAFVVAAPFAVF